MSEQIQKKYPTIKKEEAEQIQADAAAEQEKQRNLRELGETAMKDIDDLLDEIDEVLETEEFVITYVQRGGE